MAKGIAELLLLGFPPETSAAIAGALEGVARVGGTMPHLERYALVVDGSPSQIALVAIDANPEAGFEAVRHLRTVQPERPVIVASQVKDSEHVLRAMRAGARDYALLEPDLQEVVRAVRALCERSASEVGRTVSVLPAKGGSGATTVAANLAVAVRARRGLRVALVDLDLQMGDCPTFLDLESSYSLSDLVRNIARMDAELLRSVAAVHPSGLHLLAQGSRLEESDEISQEKVAALLSFLKRHYDLIVVDGLRPFDERTVAALDASDEVLLLLTQDIPAIKNARRCLDVLRRLEYPEGRVRLVLNRHARGLRPDPTTIAEALDSPIAASVANDFPVAVDAINQGRALVEAAPRSRVAQDLGGLVDLLLGPSAAQRRRGTLAHVLAAGLLGRKGVKHAAG